MRWYLLSGSEMMPLKDLLNKEGKFMLKRIILCIGIVACLLLLFYYIMYSDTNSLVEDFANVVSGTTIEGVQYGEMERYDVVDDFIKRDRVEGIKLEREWVWHNFKKGYMEVLYSYYYYNQYGERTYGARRIESKWYIEKINGRWVVVAIEEKP